MSELTYDPELPFVVLIREDHGHLAILARFKEFSYADQFVKAGTRLREIVDTTPKPKIPEDAEYITWSDPYDNGEERIAMRYGHPANRVWRVGVDTLDELDLLNDWIGDAEVTVLVRKEAS